jgi:Xaa-Pro aminopeptidase
MAEAGIDAALLTHPRDVFYYADTVRPATLLVTPRGAALLVRRGLAWAREESALEDVRPMRGFSDVVAVAGELDLTPGRLGVTLDVLSAQLYRRLQDAFPAWALTDLSPLVLAQRTRKDAGEVEAMRRAATVAAAGHRAVPAHAAPGVTELALAAEVEAAMRRAGHEGFQPLRYPEARGAGVLLMSGPHLDVRGGHGLVVTGAGLSAAMPYGPSRRALRRGDLVVLDIGANWAGYTADEARTYVVGPAEAAQRALFGVARAAQEAVLERLRPGVPIAALYRAAEAVVSRGAWPHFAPGSLTLPGFVGHGLGLEIDEPPVLWPREDGRVAAGMTLAVEIEVEAPGEGLFVKLEDTVVVYEDGWDMVTRTPRVLLECS